MKIRALYLSIILVIAAGIYACGGGSQSSSNDKENDELAVPVEVAQVKIGNIAATFTGTATLEAEEETDVVAKVGGVVKQIFVEEGDIVRAGQVLAKLDDEKIAVQVAQTRANLEKLKNDYDRSAELFNKSLISAEQYQRAKYEYESQKSAHDLVQLDLEYATIRSPISGVVAERKIKIGNMVLTNQATFRVTGLDPLLAVLHVPERQITKLEKGHRAYLHIDALQEEMFSGLVERISPVVDPGTGTIKVTVIVHEPSGLLKPGMFARVDIIHDTRENTMLVPKDAILAEDQESAVFVVQDSIALRQVITTGYINTSHIEVLEGIDVNDIIVTVGKGSLKDSTRVEIVYHDIKQVALQ